MCAMIAVCVHCTESNDRLKYAKESLASLADTVDLNKHRLFLIANACSDEAIEFLANWLKPISESDEGKDRHMAVFSQENLGTARGINLGLLSRRPGEHCIKTDEDVVWHQSGWVEEMEEVIERDRTIGIVGLKRKDVDFDGVFTGLPHQSGQRWVIVEGGGQIMGTCTMFNWRLIDKIGYSFQPKTYGFEDTLTDLRSRLAGFWNCYLPHINIDHIDRGDNPYTQEKHAIAQESWDEYKRYHEGYINGTIPIYYDGGF